MGSRSSRLKKNPQNPTGFVPEKIKDHRPRPAGELETNLKLFEFFSDEPSKFENTRTEKLKAEKTFRENNPKKLVFPPIVPDAGLIHQFSMQDDKSVGIPIRTPSFKKKRKTSVLQRVIACNSPSTKEEEDDDNDNMWSEAYERNRSCSEQNHKNNHSPWNGNVLNQSAPSDNQYLKNPKKKKKARSMLLLNRNKRRSTTETSSSSLSTDTLTLQHTKSEDALDLAKKNSFVIQQITKEEKKTFKVVSKKTN